MFRRSCSPTCKPSSLLQVLGCLPLARPLQLFLIKPQSFTPLEQPSSLTPTAKTLESKRPLKDISKARHRSLLALSWEDRYPPLSRREKGQLVSNCLSCNCLLVPELLQCASSSHYPYLGLEPHLITLEPSTRAYTVLCAYVQMFHWFHTNTSHSRGFHFIWAGLQES